jgi:hypothetical protein
MPLVRPYVRSDGTPVRGHFRWAPGARREMTIFAVFGLAVLGFGHCGCSCIGGGPAGGHAHPISVCRWPSRMRWMAIRV